MELDADSVPQPTGRFETLAADTVIMAVGQVAETKFLETLPGVEFERDGTVKVSSALMTGCAGVFAGGDMVPSERTVTVGVGHGKKAAKHIDAWLRSEERPKHGQTPDCDVREAAPVVFRRRGAPPAARVGPRGEHRRIRRGG